MKAVVHIRSEEVITIQDVEARLRKAGYPEESITKVAEGNIDKLGKSPLYKEVEIEEKPKRKKRTTKPRGESEDAPTEAQTEAPTEDSLEDSE